VDKLLSAGRVFNVGTTGSRRARKQVKREDSCGSDRNIRMPELVDNICTFLDEDRRVSLLMTAAPFEVGEATMQRIIN